MTQEIIHPVFADLLTMEGIRKVTAGMVLLTIYRFHHSVDAHPRELKSLSFSLFSVTGLDSLYVSVIVMTPSHQLVSYELGRKTQSPLGVLAELRSTISTFQTKH
ncbi:hypothetical protein YC2023_088895 [Brassica napus]